MYNLEKRLYDRFCSKSSVDILLKNDKEIFEAISFMITKSVDLKSYISTFNEELIEFIKNSDLNQTIFTESDTRFKEEIQEVLEEEYIDLVIFDNQVYILKVGDVGFMNFNDEETRDSLLSFFDI